MIEIKRMKNSRFYQSQGFRLVDKPNPELYALQPEDIHMFMKF
jgi:hypothetical protein